MVIHDPNTTLIRALDQLAPDLSDPQPLQSALVQLRDDISQEGQAIFARWRPTIRRRRFLISALNLACYLALRRRDLRSLQTALMPWGLSSLGRSEARVLPNLDAVIATLHAICRTDCAAAPSHPRCGQPHAYQVSTIILPCSAENQHLPERCRIREACDCPDFAQRVQQHAGICKHVAAKLILFLAQQGTDALKHLSNALAGVSERMAIDMIADDAVLLAYLLPWEVLAESSYTRIVAANEATVLACSSAETDIARWIVCTANATIVTQASANNV